MVVLDLGLPDLDGKDVIARVREWSDVPIIVLSARDREAEKIAALDLGADDFVNKPFGMGELMARLRTALRHRMQRKGETPVVSVGGLEIDIPRRGDLARERGHFSVRRSSISPRLPGAPCRQGGNAQADPHRRLGPAHESDTQYLRVYVGQLRQKIEPNPSDPRFILTEPASATACWMPS